MTITIKKGSANGHTVAPPSKSYAHRLLLASALGGAGAEVKGVLKSEDMLATLDCISALGINYEFCGDTVRFLDRNAPKTSEFNCRESGSTLRFFIPVAAALCGKGKFSGAKRLIERGIGIYEEVLKGSEITFKMGEREIVMNGLLKTGSYTLKGDVSSQFITGLLFGLSLLKGESTVRVLPPFESRQYVDITVDVLEKFGIKIERENDLTFRVLGGEFKTLKAICEGDWSNAAFLYALKYLGHNVEVLGLNEQSLQGDRLCIEHFEAVKRGGQAVDISNCPDLGPVLFAFAAAMGEGHFIGTRRLKIKESDRAAAMAEELSKLGAKVLVGENSVDIYCGALKKPTETLCGHNDHRIVMALSVVLTLTGGSISEAEAVSKSYPDFFEVLKRLGLEVEYET